MQNESGKMSMRQYKLEKAKTYYREHPDASIKDVARGCQVSERTAATARADLVLAGELEAGRNSTAPSPEAIEAELQAEKPTPARAPEPAPEPEVTVAPPKERASRKKRGSDEMLTDDMLQQLASENESLKDLMDMDDEALRKTLLQEVIKTALKPTNHPDTRLTATQVWVKLKDMARQADLGPGKPVTKEDAIARLIDLLRAVGPEIAIESFTIAFNIKETGDGKAQEEETVQVATPSGSTEATGPLGHTDPAS